MTIRHDKTEFGVVSGGPKCHEGAFPGRLENEKIKKNAIFSMNFYENFLARIAAKQCGPIAFGVQIQKSRFFSPNFGISKC